MDTYANARWANPAKTVVRVEWNGIEIFPKADPSLLHYAEILRLGIPVADYAPTADDVRAEAQRRIIAITGATSLNACFAKQLNAQMRANELNDKRLNGETLTAEEQTEATALRQLAASIKALRAKSNLLEGNPPADYTNDAHWI